MWNYGLFYTQVFNSMHEYAVSLMNFWNFNGHSLFQTVVFFFSFVGLDGGSYNWVVFLEVNLVTVKGVRLKALEIDVFRHH